jgi:outer membrane protein assembly factor BamB
MGFLKRHTVILTILVTAFAIALVATVIAGPLVVRPSRQIASHPTATATATQPPPTPTPVPLPAGNDWTQYRYDVTGTGVNPETTITPSNAAQLKSRWVYTGDGSFAATPAIVNGVVYVSNHQFLHAIDLLTGKVKWTFYGTLEGAAVNSSVAVDPQAQLAFYGTSSARLYAVNIATGKGAWNVQLGNPRAGAYVWSSPLVVNGKVYVGLASHDDHPCVRGTVFALDEVTGTTVWTHYTVPAGELGGSVWSSLTADPATQTVIATTGNPCPEGPVHDEEDAIVGLNWNTGATRWMYRALTYDGCDCDFGEGAVVYTLGGRKFVVAGSKYGTLYAITPPAAGKSAQLAWSIALTRPGYLGSGGIYQPPTYSNGVLLVAAGPTLDGVCIRGALNAIRADTGKLLWRQCTTGQVVSSSAVTGGIVFVAMQDQLVAYQVSNGHQLWLAKQPGPTWGGVAVSRGFLVSPTLANKVYCYALPSTGS